MAQKISRKIGEGKQKKVLSLVLCVAMMLSVMVVGAGAAFSDQSKIKNTEAVDACTALNIIGGYPDGSFKPEGNITRAEVTKMICVALNGGKNPAVSTNTTPTFSDVRNNANAAWAEGYIESCAAQGIVSGVGGGKFAPNGNVTGVQLAKMLLVSLGYKSENEGFTGNAWATNVNVRAAQKGLYVGLESMDTNAAITRDNAAQMVWNALNAYEVEYKTTLVTDSKGQLTSQITVQDKVGLDGKTKVTLLEDKYEADTAIGTFAGNSDVTSCKDDEIQITGATINGVLLDSEQHVQKPNTYNFKYNFDLKYLGEEVKVLYKDSKDGTDGRLDNKDTIYGVYLTGATSVVNAVQDDIDDNYNTAGKVSVNDKAYKVADTGAIIKNYDDSNQKTTWTNNKSKGVKAIEALGQQNGNTVKFILNDKDEIQSVYVVEYNITKVTAVNNSKVSLKNVASIDIEDNTFYDGIKKDDVVVYSKLYSTSNNDATFVVTKAETVSGKLTGYKAAEKVTIDGKTYSTMNKTLAASLTDDAKTSFTSSDINENVTAYLVNGFVGCVDMADSASNYAVVEDKNNGTLGGVEEFMIKVILADNTEKRVTVDEDSDASTTSAYTTDSIIKYASLSDSNVMDVSEVVDTTSATSYNGTNIYDKDTKTFAGIITTSDAVLFVKTVDSKTKKVHYYAYNIRTLGNILNTSSSAEKYVLKDGKVEAAFVQMSSKPTSSTSDTVYGIVTAANGTVKVGDEYKSEYKVANDKNEYTVYMPTTSSVVKGDIVSFDLASDNIYGNDGVKVYTSTDAKYIDELDKDNVLSYYDSIGGSLITKALDSDAQIVYVDQDKDKAGSDIGVGEYDAIDKYANAVVVEGTDGKIDAIIVESSGECNVVNKMNTKITLTDPQIKALADGVYSPAGTAFAPDVAGDARDNVIIKFTTKTANTATVLTIKDSADVIVYNETIPGGSDGLAVGSHYFYLNKFDPSVSSGRLTTAMVPGQTYSYTITEGAATIASGYFTA